MKNQNKKWKQNMPDPGSRMCAVSGILLIMAAIAYLLHAVYISQILAVFSCLVVAILLILVRIELYQDKKDYLEEERENQDVK